MFAGSLWACPQIPYVGTLSLDEILMQMVCFILSLLCYFLEQPVIFILYLEIWAVKNSEIFVEISTLLYLSNVSGITSKAVKVCEI